MLINGMNIENYELFGEHPSPGILTTRRWARQEQAIDQHNERVVMEVWQATALRAARRAGK